ncbi:MalY/PatB family protein [Zoogloea dura]|uniref:cysteine-S-conjugate beta-lyase n=1 Tax=Zoogloea dura TaxID=2728840 RepID=A0A848GBH4_9RHOO|nr:PatB family C-S lyase [Zoogloea dura]NML27753.1 putative C-S lyase [Zoogloea dura]
MTAFDFSKGPDRAGSDSIKWRRYAGRDVIPMWVADMDFAAPPPVLDALKARLEHGVFGYADPWPSLQEAVIEGIVRDHAWRIQPDWLVWLPGVVTGFNVAVRAVGQPGDGVFTATPVYPPFLHAPANFGQRLVSTAMVRNGARWEWDWPRTEAALAEGVRLFMLCNPHNPVGRVFDREELTRIATLAERHDLVICSDEIHCGLVLDPATPHIPIAALDENIARRSITLMAPSKTWNIPALYCAFAIIPDASLRARYKRAMAGIVPHVNVLGLTATEVAYRDGGPWREALLGTLRANAARVETVIAELPGLVTTPVEATYLAWIDCRDFLTARGIANAAAFFEGAGVGLSDGKDFGLPGFVRLNFGCPPSRLEEGLGRIRRAVLG